MIRRIQHKQLLRSSDIESSDKRLRVIGAFNPGAIQYNNEIMLLVRVSEAVEQTTDGVLACPRVALGEEERYAIDQLTVVDNTDVRKPIVNGGLCRLSYISHLELVRLSSDGYTVKSIEKHPDLFPKEIYEEFGIEDPRITHIDNTFYITYVAVSRQMSVCTALMSTTDFKQFKRHGVIFDLETKDVVLFPQKINGKYAAYIRPTGAIEVRKPAILAAFSPDLIHWGEYQYVLGSGSSGWDSHKVGAGVPPLRTKAGWLNIYHGVEVTSAYGQIGQYSGGAFMSDLERIDTVHGHTNEALLVPTEPFEKEGYVPNVVFPTGLIMHPNNQEVLVYYGAADQSVGVVTLSLNNIMDAISSTSLK